MRRSQAGGIPAIPAGSSRHDLQRQAELCAAKFDLNLSSRFSHAEAGGIGGVDGQVRSGSQLGDRRRLEAQFLGTENVFDRNDQPLRLTPSRRRPGLW